MEEEHKNINKVVVRLRDLVANENPESAHVLGELVDILRAHFRSEEQLPDGFFAEIVMRRPEMDRRAMKIQAQHAPLLATFEKLLADTKAGAISKELGTRIIAGLDAVRAHESEEIDLVQDSDTDLGGRN